MIIPHLVEPTSEPTKDYRNERNSEHEFEDEDEGRGRFKFREF